MLTSNPREAEGKRQYFQFQPEMNNKIFLKKLKG